MSATRLEITSKRDLAELDKIAGKLPELGRILSVDDIRSIKEHAAKEIRFVVDGVIAEATVNMISGESGHGKTTFTTALCGAVSTGGTFAGLETSQRKVLMLDHENPLPVVVERFNRLGVQDGPDFKVWGGWELEEPPGPNSAIVEDWVKACDPKPLIVYDSMVSFHSGNENDAGETRAYMQGFRHLADLGATVIVLHHSGKAESAKDYRGSSDIKASIDVGYHLSNLGDCSELSMLQLRVFKARFTVNAVSVFTYRDGAFALDTREAHNSNALVLQDLLAANVGITKVEFERLATSQGVARNRVRTWISTGLMNGNIQSEKGQHNTHCIKWRGAVFASQIGLA